MGNGRQNHKFSNLNRGGTLLYCAGADGNTCGRKSRGDENLITNNIDLEWPNFYRSIALTSDQGSTEWQSVRHVQ